MKRSGIACALLVSCAVLWQAGCSATHKMAGDPLLGEFGPKGANPPAGGSKTQADVPPIPSASTTPTNAALALGPLPGSKSLAIAQPPETSGTGTVQAALTAGPKATLATPEPVVQAVPKSDVNPVLPAGSWGGSGQVAPLPANDPLLAQLRARNVSWQRAENVAGGVKFSCIVPNPQNPDVTRFYEAIGPDYPAAVRAVLWQIDQKR